jgi:lysyl-tRNA synthetase, class II
MSIIEHIPLPRLEKLTHLKGRGIDPYPARYERTHTNAEAIKTLCLQEQEGGAPIDISIAGRLTANRGMGKLAFMDVTDGTGKIQLFINKPHQSEFVQELLKDLDLGDFIGSTGTLIRTRTGEPSIMVKSLTLLSKSMQPLPEKWHGLQDTEKRYRQRYLDLIANPEVREVFIRRSQIIAAIRRYLNERGFLEVETPILQPSAGGALARPFITHHNALGCNFFLRIALELHLKRLIVGGFERVYEIGRVFRNEGIDTRHNPEFTMMECYQAYADYNQVMQTVEGMVSDAVMRATGGYCVPYGEDTLDFTPPWPRLDLRSTVLKYSGIDYGLFPTTVELQAEMERRGYEFDPKRHRGRLIDDLLSNFVEPHLAQPSFLVDYPIDMSPLAKNKPGELWTVERFEAYAGRMEIANAFSELNDPLEQEHRFAKQLEGNTRMETSEGKPACELRFDAEDFETIDGDFLTALEHGMPPTGGLGVGIDRLTMLLTNQQSIREVILFPALKDKE